MADSPARLVTYQDLAQHCNADAASLPVDVANRCIDAATDYAEERMECSLLPQERTHVFTSGGATTLRLPRGPVRSITSITDANNVAVTAFTLLQNERSDRLQIRQGFTLPLTVVYEAGWENAEAVPASIKIAVLQHAATMYAQRESVSEKPLAAVPHALDDFYAAKRRGLGVG